jgi:hypothetical protein
VIPVILPLVQRHDDVSIVPMKEGGTAQYVLKLIRYQQAARGTIARRQVESSELVTMTRKRENLVSVSETKLLIFYETGRELDT